jgi:hypothetical protein
MRKALETLSIRTMHAPSIYAFQRSGLGQSRTYQLIDNDLSDPLSLDVLLFGATLQNQTPARTVSADNTASAERPT